MVKVNVGTNKTIPLKDLPENHVFTPETGVGGSYVKLKSCHNLVMAHPNACICLNPSSEGILALVEKTRLVVDLGPVKSLEF